MPRREPKATGDDPTAQPAVNSFTTTGRLTQEVESLLPVITARELDGPDVLRRAHLVLSLAEQLVYERRSDLFDPDQVIGAFGSALRAVRLERHLTLSALHRLTGIHLNTIGGVERGERNPTLRQIAQLANGLGIPIDELSRRAVVASA